MRSIQTKAPGKLYIAGEYAVVEPGYSAIITTVNLFVHLQIKETASTYGTIFSKDFTEEPIRWIRSPKMLTLEKENFRLKYILSAIHTTEEYLMEIGVPLKYYDLMITSDLVNAAHKKYGLGSSGAVTVGTVRSVLEFYDVHYTDMLVFKLSVLSQLKLESNSSFGDLAAISHTGWIRYTSFDRAYILKQIQNLSIRELVELDWPYLEIKSLDIAESIHFLIGWTGTPASSNQLVGDVQVQKEQNKLEYQYFLNESCASVIQLEDALKIGNRIGISKAIERNRQALLLMGEQTNVVIETPALTKLIEIANKNDGAAKTSGAGGGDSGIAFVFNEMSRLKIIEEWQQAGITHLPLAIYTKNS